MTLLTIWALGNNRLVWSLVMLITVTGIISFYSHPSREDPQITIRTALVTAAMPGMSPRRVEDLITRKLEEKVREMPEVEKILSTSRSGRSTLKIELYDRYYDLAPIWQKLRNKMQDVRQELPEGTQGPFVNDSYGEVAMATIALTGEGFSLAEMRAEARSMRNSLYNVKGVSKIDLYGVEDERIYVEVDNIRMAQLGLSPQGIVEAVSQTNIISPGGRIEAGTRTLIVEPSGNFTSVDDIGQVPIELPNETGQVVYLRDLAKIRRTYIDPPRSPVFFNGKPAIVLSVQMTDPFDSGQFGIDVQAAVRKLQNHLPWGYQLDYITFQPADIRSAVSGVTNNLYQTIVIVLIVVMLFLGWRAGLIVGMMVPLTMLLTLIVMRYIGIELERMSLAALIISLGLLVDNGIVIAEEVGRRLSLGEERVAAAVNAGRDMAMPLLASSLTTIVAFIPLMLAENEAGEYTRSLSLVITIALLGSWLVAMSVTPLLCHSFLPTPEFVSEERAYDTAFYRKYRSALQWALLHRTHFTLGLLAALLLSVAGMQLVSKTFFPASERTQFQVYLDLPAGSNTYGTLAATAGLLQWLNNTDINPEVVSHVAYIGDGGPRFYMGLSPIEPDPHRAFMIVNTHTAEQVSVVMQRLNRYALENIPQARVLVKPMSMGNSEAGLLEYRIVGESAQVLLDIAAQMKSALRDIGGVMNIKDDWENRLVKAVVNIDQARARRAGVTSDSVAKTLDANLSGVAVTDYREGDTLIPVYFRTEDFQRTNIDRLRTLNIARSDGAPVPLIQVADIDGAVDYAMIQRRDLERVVTVSARHRSWPAGELDAAMVPALAALRIPDGYRLERGGELEKSGEAKGALFAHMPLALALITLILIAQFNSLRKPAIILGVIPLTLVGVTLALLLMPGANLSFLGILGLLSLAGIIINNAIVLIDCIDSERKAGLAVPVAVVQASVKRLRPIVMTTITTILGLLPLILSKDVLFYDLAVVVAGGLLVGTVLTLGVVPVLYSLLYRDTAKSALR